MRALDVGVSWNRQGMKRGMTNGAKTNEENNGAKTNEENKNELGVIVNIM